MAPMPPLPRSLTVGIVGGLGPAAGAEFYRRVVARTRADDDAGHVPIVLISDPATPSRINHLQKRGPSPLPALTRTVQGLAAAGASFVVLPSLTCHCYYDALARSSPVPVLDVRRSVADWLAGRQFQRPLTLATSAAVDAGVFSGIQCQEQSLYLRYPGREAQSFVDAAIDEVKRGNDDGGYMHLLTALGSFPEQIPDHDAVLLACTDLSLLHGRLCASHVGAPVLDILDLIVDLTLAAAFLPRCEQVEPKDPGGHSTLDVPT